MRSGGASRAVQTSGDKYVYSRSLSLFPQSVRLAAVAAPAVSVVAVELSVGTILTTAVLDLGNVFGEAAT